MCGILGGNIINSMDDIKHGLMTMMHRGMDGNTVFSFQNGMKLAHNRLSIQDLSEIANQPMSSDCGRYYLAFNGELWKSTFDKFNSYLRSKYKFKTTSSDTELLLYFLIENKNNLKEKLNELEGMFSFAFYDKEKDELILGRDFIGRLPFYYYYDGQYIAFSSEVKGLTESINSLKYYNIDKGSRFNSKYKDKELIKIVEPGTFLIYNSLGILKETRYFDFKPKFSLHHPTAYYPRNDEEFMAYEGEDRGVDYYTSGFRNLLEEAVYDELISDVPVCTILSGGIDSTIITYLLSKVNPNIEAFVVNVQQKRQSNLKDDLYYARMAAKEFGIKLNEVNVTREQIEEVLKESIWAVETHKWTQVSPAVAQLFLSQEIDKRGFKVVFGGEGADEIFASYGDVKRFCWPEPIWYHQKRVNLLNSLHKTNLIRTNKAMMWGGIVELRTPFLNKKLIDFGLRIPTKYRDENEGNGQVMKYILRKAFEGEISEELLWRPKKTFQVGCHTDFLKQSIWKEKIEDYFEELFIDKNVPTSFIKRQSGFNTNRITEVTVL
jgi:asparagine synthase (glutamine-hydrolysing)